MAFKFEGKNVPHLYFRKCCWSIHSNVVRLDKHAQSKQRKATTTKLCRFTASLCTCPASSASIQSVVGFKFFKRTDSLTSGLINNRFFHYHSRTPDLSQQPVRCIKEIPRTGSCEPVESHHCIKCIFSTYGLVWFNIRNSLDAEKAEKLIKILYIDFTELKKIITSLYSNCSNYSSLFFKSFKFRYCSFGFIKHKFTVNCTGVLLILLLTSWYFFKGKEKSGTFGDFWWLYCFFKWDF